MFLDSSGAGCEESSWCTDHSESKLLPAPGVVAWLGRVPGPVPNASWEGVLFSTAGSVILDAACKVLPTWLVEELALLVTGSLAPLPDKAAGAKIGAFGFSALRVGPGTSLAEGPGLNCNELWNVSVP